MNAYVALVEWCWQIKTKVFWEKTYTIATFPTTNPTRNGLGSNPGYSG
jgi:hypothetical protein